MDKLSFILKNPWRSVTEVARILGSKTHTEIVRIHNYANGMELKELRWVQLVSALNNSTYPVARDILRQLNEAEPGEVITIRKPRDAFEEGKGC